MIVKLHYNKKLSDLYEHLLYCNKEYLAGFIK